MQKQKLLKTRWCLVLYVFVCVQMMACGQVYFPIELNTTSRSDRTQKQEKLTLEILPLNSDEIKKANYDPYKRRVIVANNHAKPAKLIEAEKAIFEKTPEKITPGPYLIGIGDILTFSEISTNREGTRTILTRDLVVSDEGLINIIGLGRIKATGLRLSELEDQLYQRYLDSEVTIEFSLSYKKFQSKKISIIIDGLAVKNVPYVATPMYLENLISNLSLKHIPGSDMKVELLRGGSKFTFSANKLLKSSQISYRIFPNDKIFIKPLNYKVESVLIVGETGAQISVPINSINRPTLSDAIFSGNVLNNITSDFSQIYVIRQKQKKFYGYHLDITNPTRVSLASRFEMRPDDIVFVATQPLSLYNRTLSQILGSTSLTLRARNTIRREVGN